MLEPLVASPVGATVVDGSPVATFDAADVVGLLLPAAGVVVTGVAFDPSVTVVWPYRPGVTFAVPVLSVFRFTVVVGTRLGIVVRFSCACASRMNAASLGNACRLWIPVSIISLFAALATGLQLAKA